MSENDGIFSNIDFIKSLFLAPLASQRSVGSQTNGLRLTGTDQQRAAYRGKQFLHVNTMQNDGYTPGH